MPDDAKTEKLTAASGRAQGYLLYVQDGGPEDRGRSLRVAIGAVTIGTGDTCDLTLHDSSVSRRHVELSVKPDGLEVRDLSSTNGVMYLGQRIERAVLQTGARLTLGRVVVDVLPLGDSEAVPLSTADSYGALIGTSAPMRRLYTLLGMLEKSEAPVLIQGETGTGKELVAKALHEHGPRRGKPFVIIDCGNIPSELMESELFGHRKGAFTGASADRAGAFESANGGTVFLDEIGELPADLQPKLLRVLETGQVKRIGDSQHTEVDVRVIAATHRNLGARVESGDFRQDLYYRVAVILLSLAPLRERREDILPLARHLAAGDELPKSAEDFFMRYDWPGNVRELRNAVQRVLALGTLGLHTEGAPRPTPMEPVDSGAQLEGAARLEYRKAREQALLAFEKAYITDLLTQHQGNLSAAARAAGIDRKHLRDLLKKHGLYEPAS